MELTLDQALQKGIEAHKAGMTQKADQYYTAILKAEPDHPDANHNMGVLVVGIGKVEEALAFFKKALEANASVAQYWLSYLDALIKLDRIAEAKAVLDQARTAGAEEDAFDRIEKKIGSTTAKHSNAQELPQEDLNVLIMLYNQDRLCQVLNEAQKLTKRYSKSLKLWNLVGASAAQIGRFDDAIFAFQKALRIKPSCPDSYNNIGNVFKEQGKLQKAIEAYTKALSIKPYYAEAYYNMGNVFQEQRKLDKAIEAYTKALSIKPDYAEAYNNLGNALKDSGKLDEAIDCYTKALSIKHDNVEAHNNMGNVYQEQRKLDKAIASYTKALSIKPDYAEAYNNLGNALKDSGKLDEAIDSYTKALSIKPDYAEAYNNLGNALKDSGKLDEAIDCYTKALSIKHDNVEAHNNMGNVFQEQRELDKAIASYTKALSIKPDYAEAYNNLGNVLKDSGKLDEAIDAYTKALYIKPDYTEAWSNIFTPLQVIKLQLRSDESLKHFYPKNMSLKHDQIELGILEYKLSRGCGNEERYLDQALRLISDDDNLVIKNPIFDNSLNKQIQCSADKMVALVHFGRSGTGLLHSLIDGHAEVSTLPSIYFSQYFDYSNWLNLISDGWEGMVDRFTSIYDVLFDVTSPVPVEGKSKTLLYNIGIKDGMASVGDQKNEVLKLDKGLFTKEMKRLMAVHEELDACTFFKLVHIAYDRVLHGLNHKSLVFYHIHNPDTYAQLNFARLNPSAKWLMMVREPIQSLESWIRFAFQRKDYSGVINRILSMLYEIDNPIYSRQRSFGLRLEDLKIKPRKTIPALCEWMGIKECDSLYEMTAQGKKWWGDPSSADYLKDGMKPFGKNSIDRKIGSIFSENDQFILRTFFYPFSLRFGYTEDNEEQFKDDLKRIRPMIDEMFDFEKKIAEKMQLSYDKLIGSGSYLYLRASLIERWNTLNEFYTYPNMIRPLEI